MVEEIRQATGGGLDYVIETAGSIPAMNLAYAIAARGGTVVSAGLPASNANFSYLHSALVSDGKALWAAIWAVAFRNATFRASLRCISAANFRCRGCVRDTITLTQINEGFDRLSDGAVLRQVLRPHA